MGGGANVAERGRGRRGDKDGGWQTAGGFDGEGVRQTTMQSVLKLCRDVRVGGCRLGGGPALAIDEGRRGGRSERSDSRRVKGRQPREREREREKERVAVLFVRAEREEQCQCSCRSLPTSALLLALFRRETNSSSRTQCSPSVERTARYIWFVCLSRRPH